MSAARRGARSSASSPAAAATATSSSRPTSWAAARSASATASTARTSRRAARSSARTRPAARSTATSGATGSSRHARNPKLAAVWNPFDVTGARAPEPREVILRNVPEAYAARQFRAITLADYVRARGGGRGRRARGRGVRVDRQLADRAPHDRPGRHRRAAARAARGGRRPPRAAAADRRGHRDPPARSSCRCGSRCPSAPTRRSGSTTCASCSSRSSPTATRPTGGSASSTPTRGRSGRRCTRARSSGRLEQVPGIAFARSVRLAPLGRADARQARPDRRRAERDHPGPQRPRPHGAGVDRVRPRRRARLMGGVPARVPGRQPAGAAADRLPDRHVLGHPRRPDPPARTRRRELAHWTHREPDDPGIALLEVGAVLGDILTFYQELYANEAYLRTAQLAHERRRARADRRLPAGARARRQRDLRVRAAARRPGDRAGGLLAPGRARGRRRAGDVRDAGRARRLPGAEPLPPVPAARRAAAAEGRDRAVDRLARAARHRGRTTGCSSARPTPPPRTG